MTQLAQSQVLFENQAEHRDRGTVERRRYADRPSGGGVDLGEQRPFANFAANQVPSPRLELLFA